MTTIEYNCFRKEEEEYFIYTHKFQAKKEINVSDKVKESDYPLIPELPNKAIIWTGEGWDYVDDYRDKSYWKIETKEKVELKLGEKPSDDHTEFEPIEDEQFQKLTDKGWEVDTEAKELADKQKQKAEILSDLNKALEEGFEFDGYIWACRDRDRSDLTGEILSWQTGAIVTPFWRSKANENVPMTEQKLLDLAKAMKEFYLQKFQESRLAIDALGL